MWLQLFHFTLENAQSMFLLYKKKRIYEDDVVCRIVRHLMKASVALRVSKLSIDLVGLIRKLKENHLIPVSCFR